MQFAPKVVVPAQTQLHGNPYQESVQLSFKRKKTKKKHLMLKLISLGRIRNGQK